MSNDNFERWVNVSKGTKWVRKTNRRGEVETETVAPKMAFLVDPEDRIYLNSRKASSADLDLFSNGTFEPIRLVETAEDLDQVKTNPNLMTEREMKAAIDSDSGEFRDMIASINGITPLLRMLELAKEKDVAMSKIDAIKGRVLEVDDKYFCDGEDASDQFFVPEDIQNTAKSIH